jgi:hypothetical protein
LLYRTAAKEKFAKTLSDFRKTLSDFTQLPDNQYEFFPDFPAAEQKTVLMNKKKKFNKDEISSFS